MEVLIQSEIEARTLAQSTNHVVTSSTTADPAGGGTVSVGGRMAGVGFREEAKADVLFNVDSGTSSAVSGKGSPPELTASPLRWNLRIESTLGLATLSLIETGFPFLGGSFIRNHDFWGKDCLSCPLASWSHVLSWEAVPFWEGPLSEVPLYMMCCRYWVV